MSSWYYFEAWARPPSGWVRQYAWGPASLSEGAAGAQFQGLVDKLQPAGEYQWVGQWEWVRATQGWHWAIRNSYQAGYGQEQQQAPPGAVPPVLSDAVLPDWPSSMVGPEGQKKIIEAVLDGTFEHQWCLYRTAAIDGEQLDLLVSCDALKVNGVRVSVSAGTQQQIADMIGGLLLTPKLVDDLYLYADVRPDPKPQMISSSKKAMIDYSARVDAEVAKFAASRRPLANVGKDWVLVNALFSQSARAAEKAANYGWLVKSDPWQGINTERAASLVNMYAIQGVGTRHDIFHTDYSQTARFVNRKAQLNGQPVDLAQVYTGEIPGYKLISHEGPLQGFRQPGVSVSASCPDGVMSEAGICTPKAPAGSAAKKSSTGGLIVGALVGGAIGAATGGPAGAGVGVVAGSIIGTVIA